VSHDGLAPDVPSPVYWCTCGKGLKSVKISLFLLFPLAATRTYGNNLVAGVGGEFNWLKGFYMPSVRVKENEPFEVALRRFKRTVEKTGLLTELRAREFYEKPTSERKRKLAAAVKRHYKRLRNQTLPPKMY